ncbi:MAG: cellulase family glycosylhydrolase [Actinobacteria bacterium]|nr:cellulase family glycosylhydrolase [Actinomycetota bacterium]
MKFPANHMLGARRNGVNHVSMNLGSFNRSTGPVRGSDYPTYDNALLDWYVSKGMASVRLMFSWEAVQSALGGPVPATGANYADYWTDLTDVLTRLLARDIAVTLAPWQFNPASGDTDVVYAGAAFTAANFADFWGKFATAVNGATGNDQRVAFDLLNEPHTHAESGNRPGDVGISAADWFGCAQAAITAIRTAGATNTVFVPGMAYTAAGSFVSNGSAARWLTLTDPLGNLAVTVHCYSGLGSASPTVLSNACIDLVAWARSNGVKVQVGEIAIDAGPNGLPPSGSTPALAQAQWSDWQQYCLANDDVLIGWHWWANSAPGWWNQGDSQNPNGFHWGLTLDNGASQTVYADLIEGGFRTPRLALRDNAADPATGPNTTTSVAWESPDIWVRQNPDGGLVGESILGGRPSTVYVRVGNRGAGDYPSTGTDVVQLYWAKAGAGLSWPQPWDGSVAAQGGAVTSAHPVGAIAAGADSVLAFTWASTPNPDDYPGQDGHFCLLAVVTKAGAAPFDGFAGPDLNANVLVFSHVAWRNIHIVPVAAKQLGEFLPANNTGSHLLAEVAFEPLDPWLRPVEPPEPGWLTLTPRGDTVVERISALVGVTENLAVAERGSYRVHDPRAGIAGLRLAPGEQLPIGLSLAVDPGDGVAAVRAVQYAVDGDRRTPIGGQTFVFGEVHGWNADLGEPAGQLAVPSSTASSSR